MLIYLLKKCNVKVLNKSLVIPSPKINAMMRKYKKQTIGFITKNKKNQIRTQNKVNNWLSKFRKAGTFYPCID